MGLITDIGESLITVFEQGEFTPELKTVLWVPKELPRFPCLVVVPPEVEFPGGVWGDGDEESRLGYFQWNLSYTCGLYVELDDATKGQQRAVDFAEKIVFTVQSNPSLSGVVDAAKVSSLSLEILADKGGQARYLTYEFNVEVLKEVEQEF